MIKNKFKIRGLKRRFRKVKEKCEFLPDLDIESLKNGHSDYEGLFFDPWNRLIKRQPPKNFQNTMVKYLVDVAKKWNIQVQELSEPYYLKVWIDVDPMITSEVVIGIKDRVNWYNHVDSVPGDKDLITPDDFYGIVPGINDFEWKLVKRFADHTFDSFVGKIEDYGCIDDFISTKNYFEKWIKNYLISSREQDGETYYRLQTGNCWVGELKK